MKKEILFNCYIETDDNNVQWLVREFNENARKAKKGSRLDIYTEEQLIHLISEDVIEQIHLWFQK